MKWNDAETAMAKLETLYPDREVRVVSAPAGDGPGDEEAERSYSVEVTLGKTVDGGALEALDAIRDEIGCKIAIGPTTEPEGGLVAALS